MMRVLITGANGFIGSHLVRACTARGDHVSAVVRPGAATDRLRDVGSVDLHRADLTVGAELRCLFDQVRPDLVFHAAAKTRISPTANLSDAEQSLQENVQSLLAVLQAAGSAETPPGAFIRLGTIAEYGENPVPYLETQCEKPRDSYGASMLTGTKYLEMLRPRLPFPAVTARLSLTYGPGQTGQQLVPYLIDCLLTNTPARIGRPDDARDLLHVDDAVRGLLMLGADPMAAGPVVNISTGVATKVRDIARMLQTMTGASDSLLQFGTPDGPPIDLINHPGLMQSSHDWSPQWGVAEGLKDTVDWAMQQRARTTLTGQVS